MVRIRLILPRVVRPRPSPGGRGRERPSGRSVHDDGPSPAAPPRARPGHRAHRARRGGPGDLPAPSDPDLVERARAAKAALGDQVFVLGHHYQRDEVIQFADVTGDSFKLAREAAARPHAPSIVFCGVHFMAESADILTSDEQTVILPDLAAGCSMADMAAIAQVEDAGGARGSGVAGQTVPVTYMNSSAAIKAFTGRHVARCARAQRPDRPRLGLRPGRRRGRRRQGPLPARPAPGCNTAVRELGLSLDDCVVWDPHRPGGGLTPEQPGRRMDPLARTLLRARPFHRRRGGDGAPGDPGRQGDRPPRVPLRGGRACRRGRLDREDHQHHRRRTDGTSWVVGTEPNLVKRLAQQFPGQRIAFLEKNVCYCSTMNRIDLPHLVWAPSPSSRAGWSTRSRSTQVAADARVALDRMLALPGTTHKD